jgi:hypothetical protein
MLASTTIVSSSGGRMARAGSFEITSAVNRAVPGIDAGACRVS